MARSSGSHHHTYKGSLWRSQMTRSLVIKVSKQGLAHQSGPGVQQFIKEGGRQATFFYSGSNRKQPPNEIKMVSTCSNFWAESETQAEGMQPPHTDAYIQTDLPRTKSASQNLSCSEAQKLEIPLAPEGRGRCHGCRCAPLDKLFKQVAMLQ